MFKCFRNLLILYILAGFHPEKEEAFFDYEFWKPLKIHQFSEEVLKMEKVQIVGFLEMGTPEDEFGKVYQSEKYMDLDYTFSHYNGFEGIKASILIETPKWALKRTDYFDQKRIIASGKLVEIICPNWEEEGKICLLLKDVDRFFLEDDFGDLFEDGYIIVTINDYFPLYHKIENPEKFLVLINELIDKLSYFIEKNDLRAISQLFHPESQAQAIKELKTPGSFIRWFFFNDISDLPEYYQKKPPKSYGMRIFREPITEKVMYLGDPIGDEKEKQILTYCKRFDELENWKERTEFVYAEPKMDVSCFNFEFINGKVYLDRYLVEDYSP